MTIDFRAEIRAADEANDAAFGRLYRTLARRLPAVCAHTITGVRDGDHTCTMPAGHIGLHRDAGNCSWGNGDVA